MPILTEAVLSSIQSKIDGHLDLTNWGLDNADIAKLVPVIQSNPYIHSVNLKRNNLDDQSVIQLAGLLKLCKLNLGQNALTGSSIATLLTHPSLEWLDLSDNDLTDESAKLLAESKQYRYLNVAGNPRISEEVRAEINKRTRLNQRGEESATKAMSFLDKEEIISQLDSAGRAHKPQAKKKNLIAAIFAEKAIQPMVGSPGLFNQLGSREEPSQKVSQVANLMVELSDQELSQLFEKLPEEKRDNIIKILQRCNEPRVVLSKANK